VRRIAPQSWHFAREMVGGGVQSERADEMAKEMGTLSLCGGCYLLRTVEIYEQINMPDIVGCFSFVLLGFFVILAFSI